MQTKTGLIGVLSKYQLVKAFWRTVGIKERDQIENSFHCLGNANGEKPENLGSHDNFYGFC